MVGMPVTSSGRHCARSERANGPSKSSSGPTPPKASRCCRAAGWWNEPSHGSAATDVSPRTSNKPSPQQPPGCSSHQSSSSHAVSQEHEITRDSFESDSKRREAALKWARSEEHTSELQSLVRISYAVFCFKKKKHKPTRVL